MLAEQVPAGSRVLVVGVRAAPRGGGSGFRAGGLGVGGPGGRDQGFSPEVGWRQLAQATFAVRAGAAFFATNTDRTIPTADGIGPGNGLLVGVVTQATGSRRQVAASRRSRSWRSRWNARGAPRLVVGDRLDTDIEGANNVGLPSLLVLTRVSTLLDLAQAPPSQRPTFLGADLRALHAAPDPAVAVDCGWGGPPGTVR